MVAVREEKEKKVLGLKYFFYRIKGEDSSKVDLREMGYHLTIM